MRYSDRLLYIGRSLNVDSGGQKNATFSEFVMQWKETSEFGILKPLWPNIFKNLTYSLLTLDSVVGND